MDMYGFGICAQLTKQVNVNWGGQHAMQQFILSSKLDLFSYRFNSVCLPVKETYLCLQKSAGVYINPLLSLII